MLEIYGRICTDRRHHNVVELMRDYSPARRFGKHGMELFDLRQHDAGNVLQSVLDRGTSRYRLTYNDRGLQFLRTFVEAREKENYFEVLPADYWNFTPGEGVSYATRITFRPVVTPLGREVTAIEATLKDVPADLTGTARYTYNMDAVKEALGRAGSACRDGMALYLSILPVTLVSVPDAVS